MLSVSSLRDAINQQLADAENKRKLADSLMKSAENHASQGDYARAQLDRNSAERYMRDLHGIEGTIAGYEIEIQRRQLKARDIDKQIDDLEHHFKHDLEQLQREKGKEEDRAKAASVVAGPTDAESIRYHLKAREVERQIEELQKHHKRDLEELQRQKNDILG